MQSAREKVILLIESLHVKVFGHAMSDEMREFLGHLSWSFLGGFIAAGIMFFVSIFAGRILGPLEFGKYNFIISLATAAIFFFLLGNNTSSIRYMSDRKYENKKGNILTAISFLTVIQAIIFLLLVVVLKNVIAGVFNLDSNIIYFVFFLALSLSLKDLLDSFIRSLGLFRSQGVARITEAIIVLTAFFLLYLFYGHRMNYIRYAEAMMFGAIFSIVYFFNFVRKHFRRFGRSEIKLIFHYNKFLILGGLIGFAISLEKVFIGKYIGIESLGIYSAYYASSHLIVSNIGILFMNTFWPAIVKNKDNTRPVIDKLNKILLKYFPLWLTINFISVYVFMLFYGRQYPMILSLIFLFSLSSLANIFFFIFINFMNIEKIFHATMINTAIYIILIGSIVIFRSIPIYLIIQIIIYLAGIVYVQRRMLHNVHETT